MSESIAPAPSRPAPAAAAVLLAYAGLAYALFAAVTAWAAGFFIGAGVPGLDARPRSPWPAAASADLALLALFAGQHTVMARPWFKRNWTRIVPPPAERATYVLAASAALALACWLWQPVGPPIWHLTGVAAGLVLALYAAGWLLVLSATFMISHTDLFGLRQAWRRARGLDPAPPRFTERGLYKRIRHPLLAGFTVVFWAAPVLTAGHLLFAAAATGYIMVGMAFEERDLRRALGPAYAAYQARVPALVPGLRPRLPARAPRGDEST